MLSPLAHIPAAPGPLALLPNQFQTALNTYVLIVHKNPHPWTLPRSKEPCRTSSKKGKILMTKATTQQTALCMLHFARSDQPSGVNKKT